MSTTRKKPQLSMNDFLDAVPVPNNSAETVREADDELVLAVPLRKRWYMKAPFSLIFPFSTKKRIGLDLLGKEVWKNCDGVRTAERIIEEFAGAHRLSFHEARLSVMLFLKELTQRGFIVMVGKEHQGATN
jgi:hypothetical protein